MLKFFNALLFLFITTFGFSQNVSRDSTYILNKYELAINNTSLIKKIVTNDSTLSSMPDFSGEISGFMDSTNIVRIQVDAYYGNLKYNYNFLRDDNRLIYFQYMEIDTTKREQEEITKFCKCFFYDPTHIDFYQLTDSQWIKLNKETKEYKDWIRSINDSCTAYLRYLEY